MLSIHIKVLEGQLVLPDCLFLGSCKCIFFLDRKWVRMDRPFCLIDKVLLLTYTLCSKEGGGGKANLSLNSRYLPERDVNKP